MTTLNAVESVRLLMKARSCIQVGIRDLILSASFHDKTAKDSTRNKASNDRRENDIAVLIGNGDGKAHFRESDT